jgi:hypothetical protein
VQSAAVVIILALTLVIMASCTADADDGLPGVTGMPEDAAAETTLAPAATATPVLLEESSCDSADLDPHPDLEALPYEYFEPTRMRGALTVYGDGEQRTVSLAGSDLTLQGVTFGSEDHGRIVELEGQVDPQEEGVFRVARWRFAPAAVLDGRLRRDEYCKMVCNEWLLFDVEQGGREYTLALHWGPERYPGLWEQAGSEVRLAGDIHGENWLGFKVFRVRYICR